MSIKEIDEQIAAEETKILIMSTRLNKLKSVANLAFSGNDNWREKASLKNEIPHLEKMLSKNIEISNNLKINKLKIEAKIAEDKAHENFLKQEQEEEQTKLKIDNPISLLEV